MSRFAVAFLASLACLAPPAHAGPASVRVSNESVPTLCAEEDNVDLRFHSPSVRRFRIEAQHPAVIGAIVLILAGRLLGIGG